jgi:NhaP-type Na+/H+ or K+/H+ antiporter
MLLEQFILIGIIIFIGIIVLSLRRKAGGSRIGYKLVLVLLGLLLGASTINGFSLFRFDVHFLKNFSVFLLIVLLFELSVRLNPENIVLDFENVAMFFLILILNIVVLGILMTFLINVPFMQGVICAIILSSVEYFLVNQLKGEGDLTNPLIIFFAFSIMVFYSLDGNVFENVIYFFKYILSGLGMGVLVGIITFKSLRNQYVTRINELTLIAVAVLTYIVTEQIAGSGLFAVMILGIFFGNSYVRKTTSMYGFSPFIFKTVEMLIFLLIGFVAVITFKNGLWWKALVLFAIYLLLRLLVLRLFYKNYSLDNYLLLTLAPKGMILGVMILVLGAYGTVQSELLTVMMFVLIYSLVAGIFVEYIEQQKTLRLDQTLKTLMTIRFGHKRNVFRKNNRRNISK